MNEVPIALVLAILVGCGAPSVPRTVSLRMQGAPADANVIIDDERIGPLDYVRARGVALPPGRHRITVEAPGYFPFDTFVEATKEPIKLDVKLVPIPD